jgi:putative membrane protein
MRILLLLLKTAVFVLLLGFAFKNADSVVVRYFLGLEWQAPLVFVLLVFFAMGVAVGVLASLGIIVRQRREILGLKRELRARGHGIVAAPATAGSI